MEPEAETETGTESESMKEWRLLAFLYNPGTTYLSKRGSTHSGLGPPKPIMNQESSTGLPTDQSDRGIFSIEVPLPRL